MATNDKKLKHGREIEMKVKETLKDDLNNSLGLEQRCPMITIEDSARMTSAGIHSHAQLNHIFDEKEPVHYEKIKSHAKKNHIKLRDMKNLSFEHTDLKLKSSPTLLSLDTSSAISTNSSGSSNEGVLTGWSMSWSLDSRHSRVSDKSSSSRRNSYTPVMSNAVPRLRITCIKGGCFLRRDSSIVVTEPHVNRLRVFSRKKGNLLATVDGNDWLRSNCTDGDEKWNRFCPTAVCETETDNVLAVTDRSKLYRVRIAGFESVIEDEIRLKNRIDLLGVAYTNQSKMILIDSGRTNRPFVGCYDSSGTIVREFKGNFSKPSYVAWNDIYQVIAIVDSGQRNVYFYDIDSKLISTFISPPNKIADVGSNNNNHLSWPSGISWTSQSQLLVADKASSRVLSFDFRAMKSENALDFTDTLREPVVLACDYASKTLMVTEEEYFYGGKDSFRLKTFRRHGVPKAHSKGLFF